MQTQPAKQTIDGETCPDARITLATERALKAPLGALRVLLEGARQNGGATPTVQFIDRALTEVRRAEDAARDLIAWAEPRATHASTCTVGEVVQSLRESLDAQERARCHFVVDDKDTSLSIDARMVVTSLSRSISERLESAMLTSARSADHKRADHQSVAGEVMLHAHADDAWATFSVVDTEVPGASAADDQGEGPSLADALLIRDIERIGGRASIHDTAGHRCCVVVVPLGPTEQDSEAGA